jgi:hypothetical protein
VINVLAGGVLDKGQTLLVNQVVSLRSAEGSSFPAILISRKALLRDVIFSFSLRTFAMAVALLGHGLVHGTSLGYDDIKWPL